MSNSDDSRTVDTASIFGDSYRPPIIRASSDLSSSASSSSKSPSISDDWTYRPVEWEVFQAEKNASQEANEDRPTVDPQFVVKVQLTGGGRVDSKHPNDETFRERKTLSFRSTLEASSRSIQNCTNALRAVKQSTKGGVFVTHSMCKFGILLPQQLPGRKFQVKFHCDETHLTSQQLYNQAYVGLPPSHGCTLEQAAKLWLR
jgi:hypothetical protein